MTITINSNIAALRTQRELDRASSSVATSFERLASGLRINRASDDAAGLSVSMSLNTDSRVYSQGVRNLNDGISALSITEGTLHDLSGILMRQRELAEQAANGVYTLKQRKALHMEANALTEEFNRLVASSSFNGIRLLSGSSFNFQIQAGYGTNGSLQLQVGNQLARASGSGTYNSGVRISSNGGGNATGDLNGDGRTDIVTGSGANVVIMLSNGDGTFNVTTKSTTMSDAWGITLADVDNDGRLDIATTSNTDGKVAIFRNTGSGTFAAAASYQAIGSAGELTTGDFNGDGIVDIASSDLNGKIAILLGNGNGTFRAPTTNTVPGGVIRGLVSGDMNGDGILDLIATSNDVTILYGNGNGTFRAGVTFGDGFGSQQVRVADLNEDGTLDIVCSPFGGGDVQVRLSNGNGTFKAGIFYDAGSAQGIQLGDMDGDGTLDIITGDAGDGTIGVLFGNTDGTFRARVSTNLHPTDSSYEISVGDFNGDGVLDLVSDDVGNSTSTVYLARTNQTTTTSRLYLLTQSGARDALATIDATFNRVLKEIGNIGANQSRISSATATLFNTRVQVDAADSRIKDADVASEAAALVAGRVRQQAAAAALHQANLLPSLALQLLRG